MSSVKVVRQLLNAYVNSYENSATEKLTAPALVAAVKELVGEVGEVSQSPTFPESDSVRPETYLTLEEILMVKDGQKMNAIKSVRTRTALGLKDAKDLVEKVMLYGKTRKELASDLNGLPRFRVHSFEPSMVSDDAVGRYMNVDDLARTFGIIFTNGSFEVR